MQREKNLQKIWEFLTTKEGKNLPEVVYYFLLDALAKEDPQLFEEKWGNTPYISWEYVSE